MGAVEGSLDPVRILLVDDDEDDFHVTRAVLRQIRSFRAELHWEKTYDSGLSALRDHHDDVCLLDYRLGAKDGLELLADARQSGCSVPIIFLTGKGERHTDDAALRSGADDYLGKAEMTAETLERSIRYALDRANHIEELRKSEQLHRRIVETTHEGVWITNAAGATTFVNAQMGLMLGRSREDLMGERLSGLIGDTPGPRQRAAPLQREVLFKRKDGNDRWTWLNQHPLFDATGTYEGTLHMVTDITERRGAEEIHRATEEQLRQAQKMEAIGTLAGGIAHDFNNLLSVVLSYSIFIEDSLQPNDPVRADVIEIRKAGERAAALTRQLLAFSRRQILEPRIVDLTEVIASVYQMLERLIGEDIELVARLHPGLCPVRVDPGQMEQVLMNLVVNARDAMPQGGKLTVETANIELDAEYARTHPGVIAGPHVMLAVTDTGEGMDAAIQQRAFEPFFTTKEKGKGTGLGLSTVLGIVKQSSGSLCLSSEPGKGTTFKVFFPCAVVTPEDHRPVAPPKVLAVSPATETILLVEDEAQVRTVVGDILRRTGYHVLAVASGAEAIFLVAADLSPIHLLLTDVVMPQMSGPELATRLAVMRPQIKVLYMSGYTDNAIAHHGILAPGIAFLQKPITPAALTQKVRETLAVAADLLSVQRLP